MITMMSASASPSFRLVEELREPPAPDTVFLSAPDESAQDELLLRKLGPRGWGRVQYFRRFYASGWGEQNGRALSPKAFELFLRFVNAVKFPVAKTEPSVFLTNLGGIELCWEDALGKPVQVEFMREGVEFYEERTGAEGVEDHANLLDLSKRLSA
jgi:hypothetical protein